jgi:hypothetical protein
VSLTNDDKAWIISQLQRVDEHVERVDEHVERVETALLTEFHKWASPMEMRARSHAAALRALDLEVEAVSDRVSKLERPDGQNQAV